MHADTRPHSCTLSPMSGTKLLLCRRDEEMRSGASSSTFFLSWQRVRNLQLVAQVTDSSHEVDDGQQTVQHGAAMNDGGGTSLVDARTLVEEAVHASTTHQYVGAWCTTVADKSNKRSVSILAFQKVSSFHRITRDAVLPMQNSL